MCSHQYGMPEGWLLEGPLGRFRASAQCGSNLRSGPAISERRTAPGHHSSLYLYFYLCVMIIPYLNMMIIVILYLYLWRACITHLYSWCLCLCCISTKLIHDIVCLFTVFCVCFLYYYSSMSFLLHLSLSINDVYHTALIFHVFV